MTPIEKQYIQKLEELITVLNRKIDILVDDKNTDVIEFIGLFNLCKEQQKELSELKAELEKTKGDSSTITDKEYKRLMKCLYPKIK